jgi:hypothetical protein
MAKARKHSAVVIPGRANGANPESIITVARDFNPDVRWLWIPGSALRAAPE